MESKRRFDVKLLELRDAEVNCNIRRQEIEFTTGATGGVNVESMTEYVFHTNLVLGLFPAGLFPPIFPR